jgi:hypothetical protein
MKIQACNAVDLTFSGDVSGHLDHAITDTTIRAGWIGVGEDNSCVSIKTNYVASLKFSLGDETFDLTVRALNYPSVGPGSYSFDSAGLNAILALGHADPEHHGIFLEDRNMFWTATAGSFTIARDMKSGTIDETFTGLKIGQPSSVRIVGTWRCAA